MKANNMVPSIISPIAIAITYILQYIALPILPRGRPILLMVWAQSARKDVL